MENVLRNFLKSDKHTLSVCGMAHVALQECLPTIKQIIEESGRECVVLSPNSRLADTGKSIYNHLYISSQNNDDVSSEQEKSSARNYSFRFNTDSKNCIYLLDNAHLLSDTKFITPDGKQYGSGILLNDFFQFADLEGSQRKAIFLGDPYQIQRSKDLLSQCNEVFRLPLPEPDTLNSAQLKNAARLACAIENRQFATFDLAVDNNLLVQNDNNRAAKQLISAYQEEDSSVWYLAETHSQTYKMTQWLRPKLLQKTNVKPLESGDKVEIYVWINETEEHPFAIPRPSSRSNTVASAGNPIESPQPLNGRDDPIIFHRLSCTLTDGNSSFILQEFLYAEKPEIDTDTAIAVQVWEKNPKNKHNKAIAYVRYGYASTVHHAQGMRRNTVYINCSHTAGKHSEVFFRWLYSALTVAQSKTVLLNFTPIHPFDQAVWKIQNVQTEIAEKIRIGAGWTWQNDKNSGSLKDYISQIALRWGYTFTLNTSHPYQEFFQLENAIESFSLRIAYNNKNQVTAIHSEKIETYWEDLSAIAQACINPNQYSNNAQMLLLFLIKQLNPHNWLVVSAIQENDYRLNITFARACHERVNGEINFDKQGIISTARILACTQTHLIEELKGLLS